MNFQKPFSEGGDEEVTQQYNNGVIALMNQQFQLADILFRNAAEGGNVSAIFNRSVLHGSGSLSPYNLDVAADFWYNAARLGHPSAQNSLWLLEAADRGGFGYDNLAKYAAEIPSPVKPGMLNSAWMICAGRFTEVVCKQYGATHDVIAFEIDALRMSDVPFVQGFVRRTGITPDMSGGGFGRLMEGSVAHQVVDGLNKFCLGLNRSGVSDDLCMMARCTVVGHLILKSVYGTRSQQLLGIDKFFEKGHGATTLSTTCGEGNEPIPLNVVEDLGFRAEIVLMMRSGKILMTSKSLDASPKDTLDGSVFEIKLETSDGDPFFLYYRSEDYYFALHQLVAATKAGADFVERCENWRKAVSIKAAHFLSRYMRLKFNMNSRIVSYSHNRRHTNVLAYVTSLEGWYPIRHNEQEPDDAIEDKISLVNRGLKNISDFISIREESPS